MQACMYAQLNNALFHLADDHSIADDMDQLPPGQPTFHSNASVTEEGDTFPKEGIYCMADAIMCSGGFRVGV